MNNNIYDQSIHRWTKYLLILIVFLLPIFLSSCSIELVDHITKEDDKQITPNDIIFSINDGNPCNVGVTYSVTMYVEPLEASQKVFYNYDTNNIDFDEERLLITFKKTGAFKVTCYNEENINIKNTIDVKAVYSEDTVWYKILSVGNSLTKYTYDVPQILKEMLLKDTPYVETDTIEVYIYLDQAYGAVIAKARNNNYSHVFLQEQSLGPVSYPERFENAVKQYHDLFNNGEKIFLYQTWAYDISYFRGDATLQEQMHVNLDTAYNQVADTLGLSLSPVGDAFFDIILNHPEIDLYDDVNNPSEYGAYLAACVHYVSVTGKSCLDPKYNVLALDEQICSTLQEVATKTVLGE